MHARAVSDRRLCDAGGARAGDPVQGAGHARPAVGPYLGRELRAEHGQAEARARSRLQMTRRGVAVRAMNVIRHGAGGLAALASVGAMCLAARSADAHHSYAMYDGSVYRVFTGVMVRVVPNAAHFE